MATVSGGEKLEAYLADLSRRLGKEGTVKVGFLEGARYPSGESVALIASINEFGAPSRGQPPRPFFRNMVAKHKDEWPAAVAKLLETHDVSTVLKLVGEGIAGQLRQSIVDLTEPSLAESTIRAKKSSKPLVDTGHMLASVDYEIET